MSSARASAHPTPHGRPGRRRFVPTVLVAAAVAVATALLAGGCAASGDRIGVGPVSTTAPAAADGSWIGGPPDLGNTAEGYSTDDAGATESMAAARDSSGGGAVSDKAAAPAPGSESPSTPTDGSPLRAGNVDDNAAFDDFLAYLTRVASSGVPFRPLDPTGRVVVTVTDGDGARVSGAAVKVSEGQREIVTLRATADGTARFHPRAYGAGDGPFTVTSGSASAEVVAGAAVTLTSDTGAPSVDRVPLDIAFAVDITGSMGDELDRMTSSIGSVVDRIEALPGSPDVRLAMTVFRDEGDSFVTATHDFTTDIAEFRAALGDLRADGGGDTPEALDEAVDEVLAKPSWRSPGSATQLVFVIGDAGGHPDRNVARPYTESMKDAAARGIKIIPIAASSTDDQAEVAFRQMAQFTGGRFVFLAYGAGGAAVGASSDIDSTDYEELSLDDLVVRLVADELSARTGTTVDVPTSVTTTTRPAGQ